MMIKNSKVYIKNSGKGKGLEVNAQSNGRIRKNGPMKTWGRVATIAVPFLMIIGFLLPNKATVEVASMKKSEKVGLEVISKSKSDGMEIESTGGGTGVEINVEAKPGENATGLRVNKTGPGTGIKVKQTGPGTGLKVNVVVKD